MNLNLKAKPVTIAGVEYPSISKAVFPTGLSFATISAARAAGTLDKLVPLATPKESTPPTSDVMHKKALRALEKNTRQVEELQRQLLIIRGNRSKQLEDINNLTNQRDRYRDQCREYDITLHTLLKCISGGK
jgi:hypothetical protein